MRPLLLLAVVSCITCLVCADSGKPPNILFILADDLGHNDVSYQGSDLSTPNIDNLAAQGIKMQNYYVHQVCTPARSSLLTGRYPIRYGLQHGALQAPQPAGLDLGEVTLAQKMKQAGYATHAFGKWHLGFFDLKYTPTYRGFDTHIGYWNGEQDYINHTETWLYTGYDFRNNSDVYYLDRGEFSSTIFERETLKLLNDYAASPVLTRKPFFIYLALQTPHAPLEPRAIDLLNGNCSSIVDASRQKYCGLIYNLDNTVANITNALSTLGILDNTLVVFSNDNGAWNLEGGYNYPYRGCKFTNWEGGVRGTSFVYGAGVPAIRKGTSYNGLMHITDWFPTLLHVAGGNTVEANTLDGIDQWNAITITGVSPRNEILHNLDDVANNSAIRMGDWKYIVGKQVFDGYFRPLPAGNTAPPPEIANSTYTYLFNIAQDPLETNNVISSYPNIVNQMQSRLDYYRQGSVPPVTSILDPASDPAQFGGVWSSWVVS